MKEVKEYAFSTVLNISYEDAILRVTNTLKEEGFGVLTQIDVKATMKKKLNKDFRKYVILGACNPPYAFRSLQADLDVGGAAGKAANLMGCKSPAVSYPIRAASISDAREGNNSCFART